VKSTAAVHKQTEFPNLFTIVTEDPRLVIQISSNTAHLVAPDVLLVQYFKYAPLLSNLEYVMLGANVTVSDET